ncbi:MAG: nucleoside-diphosphate sugar epimerase/dehydratase [Pseudomonadota bacterium]
MRFFRNRAMQLVVDGLVVSLALCFAYAMRFEGLPPRIYVKQLLLVLPYLLLLRLGLFASFGVYRLVWRYISLRDIPRILMATITGSIVAIAARFTMGPLFLTLGIRLNPAFATVPYGVLAAEFVLTITGLISVRAMWRLLTERAQRVPKNTVISKQKKNVLLIGAGSAGVMVAKEMNSRPDIGLEVLGFLDDDPRKHGTIIQGQRVLGSTQRLQEFAHLLSVDLAVITMASAPATTIRHIVDLAEQIPLKVQIIPGLYEILSGRVNITKIRDVAIEDLLGREPVRLEKDPIREFLKDKKVLVTGAGGSIGSEICRQVCCFSPQQLLLLDQAENPLFGITRELENIYPNIPHVSLIGNVVNRDRMEYIISRYQPQVIFHAAAHKHVPLMETNPAEAIRNNLLGTRCIADLAHQLGVDVFIMISTDKAVNPTSVMGATKRLSEMYVQALAQNSQTRFITVRFGNVLGSEGSVVQIFKDQISKGGPVTVTHPEMKRYFMTIPEASQLVLQAATMGEGGEIFILEMGDPVLIVSLAKDLIRLSGYRPNEDIFIETTGIRPGEKLYEEIKLSEEHANKTKHPRIWTGKGKGPPLETLCQTIDGLATLIAFEDPGKIREKLATCIPEFRVSTDTHSDVSFQHDVMCSTKNSDALQS